MGYLHLNPGVNFSALRNDLNMGNGQLAYHLKVLENSKRIKSKRVGNKKCFYPRQFDTSRIPPEFGNPVQEKIVEVLKNNPRLNQKELAEILGMSRGSVRYHLNILIKNNRVRSKRAGRKRLYSVIEFHAQDSAESYQRPISSRREH